MPPADSGWEDRMPERVSGHVREGRSDGGAVPSMLGADFPEAVTSDLTALACVPLPVRLLPVPPHPPQAHTRPTLG